MLSETKLTLFYFCANVKRRAQQFTNRFMLLWSRVLYCTNSPVSFRIKCEDIRPHTTKLFTVKINRNKKYFVDCKSQISKHVRRLLSIEVNMKRKLCFEYTAIETAEAKYIACVILLV